MSDSGTLFVTPYTISPKLFFCKITTICTFILKPDKDNFLKMIADLYVIDDCQFEILPKSTSDTLLEMYRMFFYY